MKFKHKITGEIIDIKDALRDSYDYPNHYLISAGWEDYEEPKKYWYVDCDGEVIEGREENTHFDRGCEEIGNYFETKEEAERAVEKLKAWKRLKDKGFKFESVEGYKALCGNGFNIPITATMPPAVYADDIVGKDLDICFGGKE